MFKLQHGSSAEMTSALLLSSLAKKGENYGVGFHFNQLIQQIHTDECITEASDFCICIDSGWLGYCKR